MVWLHETEGGRERQREGGERDRGGSAKVMGERELYRKPIGKEKGEREVVES